MFSKRTHISSASKPPPSGPVPIWHPPPGPVGQAKSRASGRRGAGWLLVPVTVLLILGLTRLWGAGMGSDGAAEVVAVAQPRIVIIKSQRRLHLFDGPRLVRSYPVGLGRCPSGQKICEGDGKTPEGVFRVVTRNRESRYHLFLGLSYPDLAAVERGLRQGLISPGQAEGLKQSLAAGRRPSWSTPLGGAIGIHGHGAHADWTAGCIALENHHIEELFAVMRIGDPVEILP